MLATAADQEWCRIDKRVDFGHKVEGRYPLCRHRLLVARRSWQRSPPTWTPRPVIKIVSRSEMDIVHA
jgi:hypothetical protein